MLGVGSWARSLLGLFVVGGKQFVECVLEGGVASGRGRSAFGKHAREWSAVHCWASARFAAARILAANCRA